MLLVACPENQVPSSCASPCGPVKCVQESRICPAICVEGCVCPPDTCADENGVCVLQ